MSGFITSNHLIVRSLESRISSIRFVNSRRPWRPQMLVPKYFLLLSAHDETEDRQQWVISYLKGTHICTRVEYMYEYSALRLLVHSGNLDQSDDASDNGPYHISPMKMSSIPG